MSCVLCELTVVLLQTCDGVEGRLGRGGGAELLRKLIVHVTNVCVVCVRWCARVGLPACVRNLFVCVGCQKGISGRSKFSFKKISCQSKEVTSEREGKREKGEGGRNR